MMIACPPYRILTINVSTHNGVRELFPSHFQLTSCPLISHWNHMRTFQCQPLCIPGEMMEAYWEEMMNFS